MPSIPFVTAIQNVSADVTTAELIDLTTNYGGSNPARDELALYAYLYKRDAELNDTAVTISNDDPLNVVAWSFDLNGLDGWYVAIIFGFEIWAAGTFNVNQCVYHSGAYYKALGTTTEEPGTGSDWDVITDIQSEVLNLGADNVYITQTNNFTTAIVESGKLGNVLQQLGQKIIQGKVKNSDDAATALFGAGLVESAWVNFRRGDYQDAQEIVDFITGQWAV
jgi:hypothetical protein